MKKNEAEQLLDKTFNQEFDKSRFSNFLNELFNGFSINERSLLPHKEYEENIASLKKLGNFRNKNESMEVFIVKLKKNSTLERARTLQRNVIAKLLKNSDLESALVAFYSDDSPDWRFSFIKMDYKLLDDGKVSTELTPAKRHSFLVGPNEPNYTCKKQFVDLVCYENEKPTLKEIEHAFSVESVTKEFFEKYKYLFLSLKEKLEDLTNKDKLVKEEFEEKNISITEFCKKLLGQIVFLYFLQKKGWLGVKKTKGGKFEEWGKGPRKFIQSLFKEAKEQNKDFFNEFLEPLFYEALSEDRRVNGNYYGKFDCMIPFLNGGLFEPIGNYNWQETNINLGNDLFEEIFKTFDEFNFTVKEDEPLEKEVAVDPEMLGKVFENLLDIIDRKSKGAFYTPREIVHHMCQQSLINYLKTNSQIDRKDLEIFIQKGDLALDYLRRAQAGKNVQDVFILPKSIYQNEELLDKLLQEIKIVDPAVGSGAFPVGMMNEIVKAREILNYFSMKGKKSDYELKRETIENSLYGVDIEPSAVEITKLRFWLSLIVDEEDMENIKPLPNLENKIMCGNSLIEEFEGIKLYKDPMEVMITKDKQSTLDDNIKNKILKSERKLRELRKKQKEFFDEESRMKKQILREEIDKMEWEFIEETLKEQNNEEAIEKLNHYKKNRVKPFFLWKLYFSEVFNRVNSGFDIVIANPPYVDSENMVKEDKELRDYYSKKFESAKGNWDLFIIFIEHGLNLLRKKGVISYIVPNKLIGAKYSETLRKMLLNKDIKEIRDYSCVNVFKEASVYPVTFVIQNDEPKGDVLMTLMKGQEEINVENIIPKKIFYEDIDWARYFVEDKKALKILINLSQYTKLSSFFPNVLGAATVNEAYKLKEILLEKKEYKGEDYKKLINTGTVDPYSSLWGFKKTNYIKSSWEKPIVKNGELKELFPNRFQQAKEQKIIIGGMTKDLECFLDQNGEYLAGKSTTIILSGNLNLKYILSILNSRLISFWYKIYFKALSLAGGFIRIGNNEIKKIPVKKIPPEEQRHFIEMVDKILEITKGEDYLRDPTKQKKVKMIEEELDKMIYELYELTPEEIKIVEDSLK